MTDLARLRKVGIVCAAASLAMLLSACDNRNLGETLAAIKAIKVDDSGQPPADKASAATKDHKSLNGDDLKLVANTARDLTLGDGGLLRSHDKPADKAAPHKVAIDVVDPLTMPPPDDGGPLHVLPADIAAIARLQQAARALPDIPVLTASASSQVASPQAPSSVARAEAPVQTPMRKQAASAPVQQDATRLIQIGSFSSMSAARDAWDDLQARYPVALRYKARFQPVTTAEGRQMVRLKVGPVADTEAQGLCKALAVRDSWCARAG